MEKIIGRKREQEELMRIFHRKSAQFVAIYGRRRVGKTYLVRELFKDDFAFYHTGVSPLLNPYCVKNMLKSDTHT